MAAAAPMALGEGKFKAGAVEKNSSTIISYLWPSNSLLAA